MWYSSKKTSEQTMKNKIRPIYQELQGYLSQTPVPDKPYITTEDESLWSQMNLAIDELNEITGKNYDRFKITPKGTAMSGTAYIELTAIRSKLGGLIDRLNGEYFSDEDRPFGRTPTTIITQSQAQEQSTQVVVLLEVQEKILERLKDNQIAPEEKRFLQKLKDNLSGVRDFIELIRLILITAQDTGLDLENLTRVFK